jgi:asparagine synthetase B (glutamine-hydrolysing)
LAGQRIQKQTAQKELMFFRLKYSPTGGFALDMQKGVQSLLSLDLGKAGILHLLGDPIGAEDFAVKGGAIDLAALFQQVRGHYYWIHQQEGEIRLGSSFGAIYPLYYHSEGEQVQVSSSSFYLAEHGDPGQLNRRYLLERLLFNYPFFQHTPWSDIHLLPAHAALRITEGGIKVEKPFAIEDHFGEGMRSDKSGMEQLCGVFDEECRHFLPDVPFAISFTGGFDGRTLLAAARNAGHKEFFTYSFGMPEEEDVTFPLAQAGKTGIPYLPIYLGSDYVERHAFDSALAFLEMSEYNGNLGRPHYHYAARLLSEKTKCILTGNFGSELFRAMHQPGVMMSEALIRIFSRPDGSWRDFLQEKAGPCFAGEVESLIADVEAYLAKGAALTPNQRFYRFVIEEIFRKYFGPELVMQSHLLRNRTPYLSLRFFKALNDTMWSGVHAGLFEKQKSKRMKGQQFYAAYLRRADPQLYRLPTNKGYSPADVNEPWRLPLLAARVAMKKLRRSELEDSNSVDAYFSRYKDKLARHFRLEVQKDVKWEDSGNLEKNIHQLTVAAAWAKAQHIFEPNETTLPQ